MNDIKLPTKKELKLKIPNLDKLEELYFKGYRLKQTIDHLNKSIDRREEEVKILNKTAIMKQFRTHEVMIRTTQNHIKAKYKQFKALFDKL